MLRVRPGVRGRARRVHAFRPEGPQLFSEHEEGLVQAALADAGLTLASSDGWYYQCPDCVAGVIDVDGTKVPLDDVVAGIANQLVDAYNDGLPPEQQLRRVE